MQYLIWLMVAGAVLVVIGFIGFAFHLNNAPEPTSPNDEANRARPNGNGLSRPTPSERLTAARSSVSAAAGLKAKGK
jgi:cell division protein FtsN